MPTFTHYDLALLNPSFYSPLVDVITELEHLRRLASTASQRHIQGIYSRNLHE